MRAVIFDFDGTIADSFSFVIAIAHELTHRQKLSDINYVKQMRENHVGLKEAIRLLEIPKWQWPWLLKRGRKIMRRQISQIPLFAGVDEVLSALNQAGYELYVISSNSKVNVDQFLAQKGLIGYVKQVYGSVGLFNKAKILKRVLKQHSLSNASAVYVGDEVRDIEAAKAVNIPCIAVSWGYNSDKLLLKSNPMVVARTPKQLAQVIIEWGSTI